MNEISSLDAMRSRNTAFSLLEFRAGVCGRTDFRHSESQTLVRVAIKKIISYLEIILCCAFSESTHLQRTLRKQHYVNNRAGWILYRRCATQGSDLYRLTVV